MAIDPSCAEDPFGGYGPQPVRCQWLSPQDEKRADAATVIRLVVDGNRWATHWANATCQQNVLREIAAFLGPRRGVVVTPAGMVTTTVARMNGAMEAVEASLRSVNNALGRLDFGPSPPEVLLGIDGCVPGEATPLQSVVHLTGASRLATVANTNFKLYPTGKETDSLVGWLVTQAFGAVPVDLAHARRIQTAFGKVLVLVCYDARLFATPRRPLKNQVRIGLRDHFVQEATTLPIPEYTVIATHFQETSQSGNTFKNAARHLMEKTGSTVVTTMFAPSSELRPMARRFPVRGPQADKVVTLLVEDTLESNFSE